MKKIFTEFFRRGIVAMGFGPLVLAAIYLILHRNGVAETFAVPQICQEIFSLSALAFIAGGMNVVYHIERLPLMVAIFIHGCVLYVCYLLTYLVNGWLAWGTAPILVFSAIFVLGYLVIWAGIYFVTKKNTEEVNALLQKNRQLM